MIPQLVGVEELPWRGGLIINLIDDCDGGCTWLILGSVLSNDCFKHSPEDKRLSGRVWYVVNVIQKGGGKIGELMIHWRRNKVVDGRGGCSRILACELGQGYIMWRGLRQGM